MPRFTRGNLSFSEGFVFPIWWWIGGFIFAGIGFVAFVYGKRNSKFIPMVVGILLMIYPYFVDNTLLIYVIGTALTATLYLFRE